MFRKKITIILLIFIVGSMRVNAQDESTTLPTGNIKLGGSSMGISGSFEKELVNLIVVEAGASSIYFVNRLFIQSRLKLLDGEKVDFSIGADLSFRQTSLGRDTTTLKFAPIGYLSMKKWDVYFGMGETETDNCGLLSDRKCNYYYLIFGFNYKILTF